MQIVIELNEEEYKFLDYYQSINQSIFNAIRNGTILPKHNRLIDAKELKQDIIAHKYSNDFCKEHNIDQSINVGMLNILIADAPTILEATKEGKEEWK